MSLWGIGLPFTSTLNYKLSDSLFTRLFFLVSIIFLKAEKSCIFYFFLKSFLDCSRCYIYLFTFIYFYYSKSKMPNTTKSIISIGVFRFIFKKKKRVASWQNTQNQNIIKVLIGQKVYAYSNQMSICLHLLHIAFNFSRFIVKYVDIIFTIFFMKVYLILKLSTYRRII